MKIILKFNDNPEPPIDVLPNVVRWAQSDSNKTIAMMFEDTNGTYWAYKYLTKNGTKVVEIRGSWDYAYNPAEEHE